MSCRGPCHPCRPRPAQSSGPQHDAPASLLTHKGRFLYAPAHLKQVLYQLTSPGRAFRIRDLHWMKSRRLSTWRKTSAQYPRCCVIGLTECPWALKPFSPPLGRGSPAFGGAEVYLPSAAPEATRAWGVGWGSTQQDSCREKTSFCSQMHPGGSFAVGSLLHVECCCRDHESHKSPFCSPVGSPGPVRGLLCGS
jgi:hypothetical protein